MRGLNGKVAIVTGGASGIGAAITGRLAHEGVAVAVFDLDAEAGEQRVAELKTAGHSGVFCKVDISDYAAVVEAVEKSEKTLGPTNILVNNAGWDKLEPFMQNDPA